MQRAASFGWRSTLRRYENIMTKKILIYGGSGGIGSATAELLHKQGHVLHLVGRNTDAIAQTGAKFGATTTVGDVTDETLFAQVMQDVGSPLDGMVYAVGTINLKSIRRLASSDFLNDYKVNGLGAALAIQAALPALKKAEGNPSIVLYSSVAATQGFNFHASIGMAKGAIDGLTLSLAAELAPKIRVNAIAPSLTKTPLAAGLLRNEQAEKSLADMHPMGRLGDAADIAALTAFLLSSESGWMTGQIIGVDGGRSTLR